MFVNNDLDDLIMQEKYWKQGRLALDPMKIGDSR